MGLSHCSKSWELVQGGMEALVQDSMMTLESLRGMQGVIG